MKYTSSNEAPKSYHLPAGDYDVTILEASESVARKSGADMIKLLLEATAPDGSTSKLYDYLVASPSSVWKIDSFRKALGQTVTPGEPVDLHTDELVGRTLRARLKVEEFNQRLNNRIESWLAPLAPVADARSGIAPTVPGTTVSAKSPANPAQEGDANEPF